MLSYDYEVIYKKGTSNAAADALSRNQSIQAVQIWQMTGISIISDLLSKIQTYISLMVNFRQSVMKSRRTQHHLPNILGMANF